MTFIPPLFKFSGDYIVTIGGNETTSSGIQILPTKAVAFVVSEPGSLTICIRSQSVMFPSNNNVACVADDIGFQHFIISKFYTSQPHW